MADCLTEMPGDLRAEQKHGQDDVEERALDEWDRWTNPWTELQGEG